MDKITPDRGGSPVKGTVLLTCCLQSVKRTVPLTGEPPLSGVIAGIDDTKTAFANGELDRIDIGMEQVSSMLAEFGDSAVLQTVLGSNWGSNQITFNYTCPKKQYAELFAKSEFRQAMSICVDRQEISLRTPEGFLSPAQCAPSKGNVGYDEEWFNKWTEYDVPGAQQLLENCGLKLGSDGYFAFADGSELSVDFVSLEGSANGLYSVLKRYHESIHIKTTQELPVPVPKQSEQPQSSITSTASAWTKPEISSKKRTRNKKTRGRSL